MTRLSAVRLRFGSAAMCAVLSLAANAQAPPSNDDAAWLERSRKILDESAEASAPDWLRAQPSDAAVEVARGIATQSMGSAPGRPAAPVAGRILIFASFSIPRATLRSLLSQATEPNVVLVLRGVPKGLTVPDTIRRLKQLLLDEKQRLPDDLKVPQVLLDPTLFRRYGIQRVPSFALERGESQKPVVAVGAVNTAWLRRMALSVQPGQENLGRRAEDYEISERDLIEEMQQRLAQTDWAAVREASLKNFWAKRKSQFVELPDARVHQEVLVDPSVRVTEDLWDAEGNLLVAAGHTFNPLQWVPMSKTVIVFRGTDPRHVSKAVELARTARAGGHGVILLTTSVDATRGWEHLSELERTLSGTVYLLPASLVEQFHLKRIPATIGSRGQRLLVAEYPPGAPQ